MKRFFIFLVLALLASVPALGEETDFTGTANIFDTITGTPGTQLDFKRFDKDGNGSLSPSEFNTMRMAGAVPFYQVDTNNDGFISNSEINTWHGTDNAKPNPVQ